MNFFKILLFPISQLYGLIVYFRNIFYDKQWLKSTKFNLPIISTGNLNVGGTGKTPHIEYLIRLLSSKYKVATLSRGYGRDTKGYYLADRFTNAKDIGDEPMQFSLKFKNISVAVDEDRVAGIKNLLDEIKKPELILLDDAYQHRAIKVGIQILLTDYNNLYDSDYLLPYGRLREYASGSKRADIIVVTKCPEIVSDEKQEEIYKKLKVKKHQSLFFSKIVYNTYIVGKDRNISIKCLPDYKVLLVTGIANPTPLKKHLTENNIEYKHIKFPDHHNFEEEDILHIQSEIAHMRTGKKVILTTEKDYVRLIVSGCGYMNDLMYIPIKIEFINNQGEYFNDEIFRYLTPFFSK